MTAKEKDEKMQKAKNLMADRCTEIYTHATFLRKETEPERMLEFCRKIEDCIADVRRKKRVIEDLEYTPTED